MTGLLTIRVTAAVGFWQRFIGLMGRGAMAPNEGLLFRRCTSVHTFFMRFALDLVALDAQDRICGLKPGLKPWRLYWAPKGAAHILELEAGSIARLSLQPGERLPDAAGDAAVPMRNSRQRGATMVEFAVVAPLLLYLLMLATHFSLLYLARSQVQHATFMAARAGTVAHAELAEMRRAFLEAMVPLYGGGMTPVEVEATRQRVFGLPAQWTRLEILNPSRASFDDWHSADLKISDRLPGRVNPNQGLSQRDPSQIGPTSGQNIQDANVLRLRLWHAYETRVPFVTSTLLLTLELTRPDTDPAFLEALRNGRWPIESVVTMQMQSDAVEQ